MTIETLNWGAIASAAVAVVALFALMAAYRFRRDFTSAEQSTYVTEYLHREYLDRQIPLGAGRVCTFKEAREFVRITYPLRDSSGATAQIRAFTDRARIRGTWENAVAYHLSLGIERLGVLAYSGALPLRLVLNFIGHNIVEDWAYCQYFVQDLSEERKTWAKCARDVLYPRRHGEWLACLAALDLEAYWEGPAVDRTTGLKAAWDRLRREERLRRLEPGAGPPRSVCREVNTIRLASVSALCDEIPRQFVWLLARGHFNRGYFNIRAQMYQTLGEFTWVAAQMRWRIQRDARRAARLNRRRQQMKARRNRDVCRANPAW